MMFKIYLMHCCGFILMIFASKKERPVTQEVRRELIFW
jgi:hypothetical protein